MLHDSKEATADADGNEFGKLFVGGLSQVTNECSLRAYFSEYGLVEDAVVMMDNQTGRSRGFGFVKFKDPARVDAVLESNDHVIDSKPVDVKQSNINIKGKTSRNLKIFVGGIAPEHDAELVRGFFAQYGKVTDVNLMLDQSKQRHRGFAFVAFDDERVVQRLVQLHFVEISGRIVEIKAMKPPNFEARAAAAANAAVGQSPAPAYRTEVVSAAAYQTVSAPLAAWGPPMSCDPSGFGWAGPGAMQAASAPLAAWPGHQAYYGHGAPIGLVESYWPPQPPPPPPPPPPSHQVAAGSWAPAGWLPQALVTWPSGQATGWPSVLPPVIQSLSWDHSLAAPSAATAAWASAPAGMDAGPRQSQPPQHHQPPQPPPPLQQPPSSQSSSSSSTSSSQVLTVAGDPVDALQRDDVDLAIAQSTAAAAAAAATGGVGGGGGGGPASPLLHHQFDDQRGVSRMGAGPDPASFWLYPKDPAPLSHVAAGDFDRNNKKAGFTRDL